MVKMQYAIKNKRNVYIRVSDGKFMTCSEKNKDVFEYSKACNIVKSLPKHLRRMRFQVEGIPDITPIECKTNPKTLVSNDYEVSENVLRWVDKIGSASDILQEAIDRRCELNAKLRSVDNERMNILHEIELNKSCDMYTAWKKVKKLKETSMRRRDIKDEMLILEDIVNSFDQNYISRKHISNAIAGLSKRKYTYRIVDVEDEVNENETD